MKLGELFVDLGVNSGGALSSISAFAFKFNQLADLAKTLTSAFDDVLGTTPQYAHSLNIFSQSTEVAKKSIQGMMIAAKENGGSIDEMISKIQKYDDEVFQMKMGKGNLAERLGILGLDVNDVLRAKSGIDIISAVLKQADSITSQRDRESFLRAEGFTTQQANIWREYIKDRAKYDNDRRSLTKDEIKNLDTIWKIQQRLGNERRMALDKLRAQNASKIVQWETKLNNIMMAFDDFVYGDKSLSALVKDVAINLGVSEEHIEKVYDFFKKTKNVADDFSKSQFWELSKEFSKGFIDGLSSLGEGIGRLFYVLAHPSQFSKYSAGDMVDFLKNGKVYQEFKNKNLVSSALGNGEEYDLRTLGLKGSVWEGNSKPFIPSRHLGSLLSFDKFVADRGIKAIYTSNMGGNHALGSGHYSGDKFDVQFTKNGKHLTPNDPEMQEIIAEMHRRGMIGKGAVGYEKAREGQNYGHWDLGYGNALPLEEKSSGASPVQYITLNSEVNVTTNDSGVVSGVVNGVNQNMKNFKGSIGSYVWGATQ